MKRRAVLGLGTKMSYVNADVDFSDFYGSRVHARNPGVFYLRWRDLFLYRGGLGCVLVP